MATRTFLRLFHFFPPQQVSTGTQCQNGSNAQDDPGQRTGGRRLRLHSHLSQLEEMLNSGVPVGRKLDFLIQEFNREANTIGSKCTDLEIARHVVDIKAEIEKIREQVQNVE